MSQINKKIAQCENDIASLQENLRKLKEEKEEEKPKFGDIVEYITLSGTKLIRVVLYDSIKNLQAFNREGKIVGSINSGLYTRNGKNIFKDNLLRWTEPYLGYNSIKSLLDD